MQVSFSIIMVCKNSEKTIGRALGSLVNQTYKNYELIIVDGESEDQTLTVISEYKNKINNMTVISELDKGIYDAMNKGVKLSSGKLIAFLNSDDYYEVNALESIISNYQNEIDVIYGDTYLIENIKGIVYEKKRECRLENLIRGQMISHPSTFVKAELLKQILFDDQLRIAADYKFILKIYLMNKKFKHINSRINNMLVGGISSSYSQKAVKEMCIIQKELIGKVNLGIIKLKFMIYINGLMDKIAKKMLKSDTYLRMKYELRGWEKVN